MNPFETDLDKNAANFVPLSPLGFLARSAAIYPARPSVIHGTRRYNWAETYRRCRRFAGALAGRGIGKGDTVAIMAPNVPELFEAHFGVPMTGAVLNAINTRLDAETIAFILDHGGAKLLITDREFSATVGKALTLVKTRPLVIDIDDALAPPGALLGECDYESFIAAGDPDFAWTNPADEWDAIALNYTSGTTGNPKGVVYHHRGAYLNALGNILVWSMPTHPVYLWTLPMFHCNGWCFPWSVTALAGTHVCLRRVEAGAIYEAIEQHGVTHLCGAPVVMNMLLNARNRPLDRNVAMMTAGAAPPAAVISGMEGLGFRIAHVYGLTEVYGPAVICAWHDEWDALPADERARLKSRHAVAHPDGYIEIKDRSKDIIISGGENISTIEVEDVLYRHPAVLEAAIVARPDANWGETPCAFVTLKDGAAAEPGEIIAFCREHLAHFKAPRHVIFGPLPKTSTGKIQKFVLRERAKEGAERGAGS